MNNDYVGGRCVLTISYDYQLHTFFPSSLLLAFSSFSCYVFFMTIEQTVAIPADYRIYL